MALTPVAQGYSHRFRAMGSPCEIILTEPDTEKCRQVVTDMTLVIERLEQRYSRFLPDSLTTSINNAAGSDTPVPVDEETSRLLDYADTCYHQSGGLFDITSGSLRKLWNYQDLEDRQTLPDENAMAQVMETVGWHKVQRDAGSVLLPVKGMEIDFGGIVKEYAADCLAGIAQQAGLVSGLVELGGDIRIIGGGESGPAWNVGIRDPFHTDRAIATISLPGGALASSGDYERYAVIQGKKYSHILNPLTGWPVDGYCSVSVAAQQCTVAGSAATIAVLKGEKGRQWLDELGLPYFCIDDDGNTFGSLASA